MIGAIKKTLLVALINRWFDRVGTLPIYRPIPLCDDMPVCRCHSFDSLEAQTAPIVSHADISNLVTISALELIPMGIRTEAEGQLVHERIMKLQEDFLRVIAE